MKKRINLFLFSLALYGILTVYFFLFTKTGGALIVRTVLPFCIKAESIEIGNIGGYLADKITLEEVRVKKPKNFPDDVVIKLRQIDVWPRNILTLNLNMRIENGELQLPYSQTVNFNGSIIDDKINIMLTSDELTVYILQHLLKGFDLKTGVLGDFSEAHIHIGGSTQSPEIEGNLVAEDIFYNDLSIGPCLVSFKVDSKFGKKKSEYKIKAIIENAKFSFHNIKDSYGSFKRLELHFDSAEADSLSINIFDGRFLMPDSENIVFHGDYRNKLLSFNIYSKSISVDKITTLFSQNKIFSNLRGALADIDLDFEGDWQSPKIRGSVIIENIISKNIILKNIPLIMDLSFIDLKKDKQVDGAFSASSGKILMSKNIEAQLSQSQLLFFGNINKPKLDIKGVTNVEGVIIRIFLTGTLDNPQLKLSSDPALPQEQLLLMVMTGKKWDSLETFFSKGSISPDLAIDFIDYFILGGTGSKIGKKFGIKEFSIKFDDTTKGIEIKKELTNKTEIGYGLEQIKSNTQDSSSPTVTQKVSGEYKVTENVSIGAEKELKQNNKDIKLEEKQKSEDKVIIKFKKDF